jgi:uncharacterized SAM-binding protein YcdF (DUF218 family)
VNRFFGLLTRKERWGLSWRGWVVLTLLVSSSAILLLLNVQPFLAETDTVNSKVLVVEGWIHNHAIRAAVKEFRARSYQLVCTTGGPVEGTAGYINDYQTSASVGADLLKANGVPAESLQMVPSRVMSRDRTYGAALALREWFHQHHMVVSSVNVLTEDVHARRTRLLFQEALGRNVKVGIIAVSNPGYDAKHWWLYSIGLKEVVSEGCAYLYAKILFHPSNSSNEGPITTVAGSKS